MCVRVMCVCVMCVRACVRANKAMAAILPHKVQSVLYLHHMVEPVVKAKVLCWNTVVF